MKLRRLQRFYMLVLAVLLLSLISTATASGSQPGSQWGWEVYREALSYSRDYQGTIRVESPGGGVEIAVLKVGDLTRVTLPRDGGQTTILRKGEKVALKGLPIHGWWKLLGPDLPLDEALLQQNYMLKAKPARWEGREIWRLELTPRHPGNPSRLVMVDRAWLLPLYMEDRSSGGQVIQSRSLKGLVAPPRISATEIAELERLIRDEGRKIPGGPPPIISAREAARDLGFEPVLPGYLPEGYRLLGVRISRRESGHSLGGKRDQAHPCGGCARGGTAQDGKVL